MNLKISKSKLNNLINETPYFWMGKNRVPGIIGRPQRALVELLQEGKINGNGNVLVIGCKTGDNALTLAKNGLKVIGIHRLPTIMHKAIYQADKRGLDVEFVIDDPLEMSTLDNKYDVVFDAGFFQTLSDNERLWFIINLKKVIPAGGKLFMVSFRNDVSSFKGIRGISHEEIYHTFREGWEVESIREMDITTTFEDVKGWLVEVVRKN